jgi:hypothetical protein
MINKDININSDSYDDNKWSIVSDDIDVNYCDDDKERKPSATIYIHIYIYTYIQIHICI